MGYNGNNRRLRSSMFKKSHTKKGSKIISSIISTPFSLVSDNASRRKIPNRKYINESKDENMQFSYNKKKFFVITCLVLFVLGLCVLLCDFYPFLLMLLLFPFFLYTK